MNALLTVFHAQNIALARVAEINPETSSKYTTLKCLLIIDIPVHLKEFQPMSPSESVLAKNPSVGKNIANAIVLG